MGVTQSYGREEEVEEDGWGAAPEPDPGLLGQVLAGRYRIVRRLGQGGMATVYEAEHVDIGRRCAVKVLSPAYASDPESVERFLREARASSKLRHPHVIEIVDFGRAEGTVFFVMELLEGEDLLTRIERQGRIPWAEARVLLEQVCDALAAAHRLDIVHRDLKPENVFCVARPGGGELVKVLDFGIARVNSGTSPGAALTQAGRVFGTPAYMSPEQADGQRVDLRSDVYSLGVTMYHMLTGQVPFPADTPMGFLKQHMFSVPRSPRAVAPAAEIPVEAEAIVLKALQKDPALRFQDMAELVAAIREVGSGRGPVKVVAEALAAPPSFVGRPMQFQAEAGRPRWLLLVAAGGAALVLVAGALLLGGEPAPASAPPPPPQEAPPPPIAATPPTPPPAPPPVRLRFDSDAPAQVFDAESGALLGKTGDDLTLPHATAPRSLVLRAEGFEDLAQTITPDRDQTLKVGLKRKKRRTGKTGEKSAEPDLRPIKPEFGPPKKR